MLWHLAVLYCILAAVWYPKGHMHDLGYAGWQISFGLKRLTKTDALLRVYGRNHIAAKTPPGLTS